MIGLGSDKNWLLAPNIQNLGSKKHIFAPSDQFEPHRSMFSTRKRCLMGLPIQVYKNFYSLPPKNLISGPKTAKFGPKLAFWAKYQHFCPIWSKAWPKNDANKLSRWFSVMLVPKLLLTPIKIRIFGPNLVQNLHFWSFWARPCRLIQCPVVGRLVVVARGLYLARHLFTLL